MRKAFFAVALAATLAIGAGAARAGTVYDISRNNEIPSSLVITDNDFIYQDDNDKGTGNDGSGITISSGFTLTVGQDDSSNGQGFSLDATTVTIGAGGTLAVTSATEENATHGYDVTLGVGTLSVAAGATVDLSPDTQGKVILNVDTLTTGSGASIIGVATNATMNVGAVLNDTLENLTMNINGGTASFADTATVTLDSVTMNLGGGAASFAGAVTLSDGLITADADSVLAVGGGLTVDSAGSSPTLQATNGAILTVLKSLNNAAVLGDVTIGGTTSSNASIDLQNGSTIEMGNLILDTTAVLTGSGSGNVLQAKSLHVKGDFTDSATVATRISGATVVDAGTIYTVNGEDNTYGSMTLYGTLEADPMMATDTKITLGSTGTPGSITVDGGTIQATNDQIFAIENAAIVVIDSTPFTTAIDASGGTLDLSTSSLTVDVASTNVVAIVTTEGITVKSFTHKAGQIEASAGFGTGKMVVLEKAVIGSAGASTDAVYSTDSYATVFQGGVTLVENGSIVSTSTTGEIGLGAVSGTLEMAGGSTLDGGGTGNALAISNAATGGTAYLKMTGLGNSVLGAVDSYGADDASAVDLIIDAALSPAAAALRVEAQTAGDQFKVKSATVARGELSLGGSALGGALWSAGDVIVKSGGKLSANGTDSTVDGAGDLRIASGGALSATTANLTAMNFDSVSINGIFTAGYDAFNLTLNASGVTGLIIDTSVAGDVTVGSTGVIAFTNEAALKARAGDVLIKTNGQTMDFQGQAVTSSIFGSYTFAMDSSTQQLVLQSVTNRIYGTDSADDRATGWNNLKNIWGTHQIGRDLADIVYDASVVPPNLTVQPGGSVAGEKNLAIFQAIGNSTGKNIGRNTVEYVNGAYLYGVTNVAMETSRAFFSDVSQRAKAINGEFIAVRDSMGSVDALASTAMNENYANRFWAGGFGLWQDADTRQGFSGYRYDSWGAIMGYDRVVAGGLAVGASAAYNKGDYSDKGALAHDSNIESYTGGLYAIYSHESGFTSTLFGAYTYSKNDINELRHDPYAGVNSWSKSKFHTGTWSAGGNLGWDFRPSACFTITPTVGLNYIRARNSDHSSSMGGIATQRTVNARNHGLFLPAELTMQYDVKLGCEGKLRFEAGGGYAYNFNDDGMDGSMSYFDLVNPGGQPVGSAIRTRDNSQHSYKVGGGMRYNYKQFDVGVRYDYMGKTDYKAHRVVGSIGISF